MTTHVIANTSPGATVIAFWGDDEFFYERYPVIAWEVDVLNENSHRSVLPIISEPDAMNSAWCLEEVAGDATTWRFLDDCAFTTFQEAYTHATKRLKDEAERQKARRVRA